MKLRFYKYHGAGNDFIIIENFSGQVHLNQTQVASLCNRHFGVGADGLILLQKTEGYDFSLKYFNSDGKESSLCGNGSRCAVACARQFGMIALSARFLAADGMHFSEILSVDGPEYIVRLKMNDALPGNEFKDGIFIDTGSPHFVRFVEDVHKTDVIREGRTIRLDPRFAPGGTNADFVTVKQHTLEVRTYERGVEDETLSCGTGVTAAALATAWKNKTKKGKFRVITSGGSLNVYYSRAEKKFHEIYLEGPAKFVFEGEINI